MTLDTAIALATLLLAIYDEFSNRSHRRKH
jgi:hypothetical protein